MPSPVPATSQNDAGDVGVDPRLLSLHQTEVPTSKPLDLDSEDDGDVMMMMNKMIPLLLYQHHKLAQEGVRKRILPSGWHKMQGGRRLKRYRSLGRSMSNRSRLPECKKVQPSILSMWTWKGM